MSQTRLATLDLDAAAAAYDRDGCIRVRGFFDVTNLAAIRAALDRYFREIAPTLAARPEILRLVSRLVRGDPVLLGRAILFCRTVIFYHPVCMAKTIHVPNTGVEAQVAASKYCDERPRYPYPWR